MHSAIGTRPLTPRLRLQVGVDTRTIQAYLGHKSIQHYRALHRAGTNSVQKLIPGLSYLEISRKGPHFFLMKKGDPTPMVPIEGGARKRCVKHPSTSLPPSSARPKNTPPKNYAAPVIFDPLLPVLTPPPVVTPLFSTAAPVLFSVRARPAGLPTCNLSLENKWSALSAWA